MTSIADAVMATVAVRVESLMARRGRTVLGITGAPGSGKTTFADALAEQVRAADPGPVDRVARVPMDGFHLADAELTRRRQLWSKGAPETFDVGGYVSLLRRLHEDRDEIVYAPAFDRRIEQPVAGSIPVPPSVRLIITEGNYLLADGAWSGVRPWLTETWYLEVDDRERLRRLVARHEEFGKPADAAREWAHGVDQRNADLVAASRHRADLVVHTDSGSLEETT